MACNNDDVVSVLKNEDEDDRYDLPIFDSPDFQAEGTLVLYKNVWLYKSFPTKKTLRDLETFQFKDDIVVASFPKSGTTWVQEIVSQIESLHMENGKEWKSTNIEDRFPFLEYIYPGVNKIAKMKSPRFIKTHLPYQLLPPSIINGAKIIYITRDPRDVVVSYYHFIRMLKCYEFTGTFDTLFDFFISGKVGYGPWDKHVISYWEKRNKNLYFLTYESLHQEPHKVIKEISLFIDKPVTDEQLDKIVQATMFDNMKVDPSTNYEWWDTIKTEVPFFRKGVVGDWRNYLDESKLKKVEKLLNSNPVLRDIFIEMRHVF